MNTRPERAMVLAAGLGRRMRAADSTRPKPLVPLAGAPLIVYAFARLREAGIGEIVVNTHYLAEQIDGFLVSVNHPGSNMLGPGQPRNWRVFSSFSSSGGRSSPGSETPAMPVTCF